MRVLLISLLLFVCIGANAQRQITKKSFEEYVTPDSSVVSKHPAVLMDVDRATMYYVKSIRYDSLGKAFPELEQEFNRLDDSIQNVLRNTDSLLLVIAQRDSLGSVMFQTCEEAKDKAVQTAIQQRGEVIRLSKVVRFFKPIVVTSLALNLLFLVLFVVVL